MLIALVARITRVPWARTLLWKGWYRFLARRFPRPDWSFMNYGYAVLDPNAPRLDLEPADEPDRLCIQLYHHVVEPAEPEGKDVLEVGSGRGGGASYVARRLGPRSMIGADFSPEAVALANGRFARDNLRFVVGDAGNLPFPDASFDVVLNVESSHCYPSRPAFFAEVRRVLRPGGRFQFADLFQPVELEETRAFLRAAGLRIESDEEITPAVIAALEESDEMKRTHISKEMSGRLEQLFKSFAGVKGSEVYNSFKSGDLVYRAFSVVRD